MAEQWKCPYVCSWLVLMDYSWSTTIPNWSKGNNRTKDSATSLTWLETGSNEVSVVIRTKALGRSDFWCASAESEQQIRSSCYCWFYDGSNYGRFISSRSYWSWVVKNTQWHALKSSWIQAFTTGPLMGSQLIFLEETRTENNAIDAHLRIDPNIILRVFLKGKGKVNCQRQYTVSGSLPYFKPKLNFSVLFL